VPTEYCLCKRAHTTMKFGAIILRYMLSSDPYVHLYRQNTAKYCQQGIPLV